MTLIAVQCRDSYLLPRHPLRVAVLDSESRTYILVGMVAIKPHPQPKTPMVRHLRETRQRLLQAAYEEVFKSGFRSASLDAILDKAEVTKGALYHYFPSKEALGHAILDEVIAEQVRGKWQARLEQNDDPIAALIQAIQSTSFSPEHVNGGCPLNNLAQEMSSVDEGFRKRISRLFHAWESAIAKALRRGQAHGLVRKDVDADEVARFIVATYEGYIAMAKNFQDAAVLRSGMKNLVFYVESLRVPDGGGDGADDPSKTRVFAVP
jgi:TetR/AcrR family transcriptional regulator, transcriptional repressor for nem operon